MPGVGALLLRLLVQSTGAKIGPNRTLRLQRPLPSPRLKGVPAVEAVPDLRKLLRPPLQCFVGIVVRSIEKEIAFVVIVEGTLVRMLRD